MLLAEMFAGSDAAVIITAIVGTTVPASLALFKYLFPTNNSENNFKKDVYEKFSDYGEELAAVRVKAETAFDMLIKQAVNAVIASGIGTKNSPLTISQEARSWLEPLKAELQAWYLQVNGMGDRDQLFSLEKTFGIQLLDEVCIPHRLVYGVCLLIAFAVASDNETIDLPFLFSPEKIDVKNVSADL